MDELVATLGDAFPELRKDPARVKEIIQEEELSFSKTLKKGIAELSKRCEKLPKGGTLPGEHALSNPNPNPNPNSNPNPNPNLNPRPTRARPRPTPSYRRGSPARRGRG